MANIPEDRQLTLREVVDWLVQRAKRWHKEYTAARKKTDFDAEDARNAIRHRVVDHLERNKLPWTGTKGAWLIAESDLRTWARSVYPELTPDIPLRIDVGMGDTSDVGTSHVDLLGHAGSLEVDKQTFRDLQQQLRQVIDERDQLRRKLAAYEKRSATARKNARRPRKGV